MSDLIKEIVGDDFDKVVIEDSKQNPNSIYMVDIYSTSCLPCKMLARALDEVAPDNDNINIYKLDIEESGTIYQRYNVQSAPTLLFIKNGELVNTMVGAQKKNILQNAIDTLS
jgi:thioredoxin 1